MKVINKKGDGKGTKTKYFRLPLEIANEIERLATEAGTSENALIIAILQKVLKDPKFSVEL